MRKITHFIAMLLLTFAATGSAWAQLSSSEVEQIRTLLNQYPAAVGYPSAESFSRLLLEGMIEDPEQYQTQYVNLAIERFYNETEIMMPEDGKKYTIAYVCSNGNKFYAEEKGEDGMTTDIAMTNATYVTNVANQPSLHFTCRVTDGGKFNLITANGKYYTIHSSYTPLSWMSSSTTGFTETYDAARNDLEFKKLDKDGAKVSATDNSELMGMMYVWGMRGLRNDNGQPEMGCHVAKTDGSNYDGAGDPFYNESFSSAVILTEVPEAVAPLTLVSTTPEGGTQNSYTTFPEVTLQFDQSVTIAADMNATVSMRNGSTEATVSATVNADDATQVILQVTGAEETGYYMISVPAGMFVGSNGAVNEDIYLNYLIEQPILANTYNFISVDPEDNAEVEKLETIVLTYPSDDQPGYLEEANTLNVMRDGEIITTVTPEFDSYDWDLVKLILSDPITEAGTYTITVPEKTIWNLSYDGGEPDNGVKYGATYNAEFTLTYTVVPAAPSSNLGEPIKDLAELSNDKCYVLHNPVDHAYAVYDEGHGTKVWAANDENNDFSNGAVEFDEYAANCTWMAVQNNEGGIYLYNMGNGKYLQTPAWVANDKVCYAATFSDDPVKLSVITRADGNLAITAHPEDDHTYLCASAGSPDRLMSIWTSDDHGCAWEFMENPNIEYNPEVSEVITGVLEAIEQANAPKDIYNLSGVKMNAKDVNKLEKGVYIVNGKKVVVK